MDKRNADQLWFAFLFYKLWRKEKQPLGCLRVAEAGFERATSRL